MSKLVIVAIPALDDPIHKISSEKVPHLTLLYLGDTEKNEDKVNEIYEFVWHAVNVNQHGPFELWADYRGILGEDLADVIHFRKNWSLKWVEQLRHQLLQNGTIRTAYDSAKQHDGPWKPHLTLGYPETPANDDEIPEHGIEWVRFDRIAVWTGNYEGPWFRLKWPDYESELEIAWSGMSLNEARVAAGLEAIEHFGVKGMRWGVRNPIKVVKEKRAARNTPEAKEARAKKKEARRKARAEFWAEMERMHAADEDAKFKTNANSAETIKRVHDRAFKDYDEIDVPRINSKPEYANADLTRTSPLQARYHNEHKNAMVRRLNQSAAQERNYSDTHKYAIEGDPLSESGWNLKVIPVRNAKPKVEHAATTESSSGYMPLKVSFDERGHITKIEFLLEEDEPEETLAQTALTGEDFASEYLAHYGVKGMHWGVRRERTAPEAVAPSASSIVPRGARNKTKIQVKGGENHPASDDAIKVAQARAKLAKSGPAALSNAELREVATRLQLEQQVSQMTTSGARKFITNLLSNQGKQQANLLVSQQVNKKLRKAAA